MHLLPILIYGLQVASCPPGSQGACLDIVSTYHNSSLLPAQKAYVASMWRDGIYIYHCTMEHLSSASNIQGTPADALIAIFKLKAIPNVLKWVDDLLFFHIPSLHPPSILLPLLVHYDYEITTILAITNLLGVPWHLIESKGQEFQSVVTYIGFIWSFEDCSILLSCKKNTKYLSKVSALLSTTTKMVSHKECLSIHSTLQHITLVYQDGWAFLPPLSSFLSKFRNDFMHLHLPAPVIKWLRWWQAILSTPCTAHSLMPRPMVDLDIWVDALMN